VIVGAGMRGNLFRSEGGDAFAALGYFADLGTGSFYWLANISRSAGRTSRMLMAIMERVSRGCRLCSTCWPHSMLRSRTRAEGLISMKFHLSHLQAMLLFALMISIAFGFLSRRRPLDRVKYIVWSLFLFCCLHRDRVGHVPVFSLSSTAERIAGVADVGTRVLGKIDSNFPRMLM